MPVTYFHRTRRIFDLPGLRSGPPNEIMVESGEPTSSEAVALPCAEIAHDIETWVFDLDNTLYPAETNLFAQIDVRMREFIADYLALDLDEAYRVQKTYFREYGTTLRGLMSRHGLDPKEFLDFVHAIDLSPVSPSPALDAALDRLSGRKIIFTNASTDHADRVMDRLGVGHHFDAVFDIKDADYLPKPDPAVYDALVERYSLDPHKTVMVEDIARNLAPAAALGMTTVWVRTQSTVGQEGADAAHVHHVIDDLADWLQALADLPG